MAVADGTRNLTSAPLRYRSRGGRLALAATVLGSAAAFVEGTVVTVALPAIGRDLGLGLEGLQWILNAYLLTLSALILLGGSLGDRLGHRRVFVLGSAAFAACSLGCALAPSGGALIGLRALQGAAGALLVPASLAILEASFAEEERAAAIGAWSGFSAVASAVGPFLGGWLVDAVSWRLVFLVVVGVALPAIPLALAAVPETPGAQRGARQDWAGAALASGGLAGVVAALVQASRAGLSDPVVLVGGLGGVALLGAFLHVEARSPHPLLPLEAFRNRQFSGANLATLANYFALGGAFFLLSLELQDVLGYTALQAGAALFPATLVMLLLSARAGALAQRLGPRLPMTVGPLVAAAGLVLLGRAGPASDYVSIVLPGVLVFGLGITIFVAPLTAAVLAALGAERAGVASAVNNAAARLAQLLAAAVLPLAASLPAAPLADPYAFAAGFRRAMWICAAAACLGGLVSLLTIRRAGSEPAHTHPCPMHGCSARETA